MELVDELKAKHGTIFGIEDEEFGTIYFRLPKQIEIRKLRQDSEDDVKKHAADDIFARSIVVHPTGDALEALVMQYPAILSAVAGAALRSSGARKLEAKKL